MCDDVQMRQIVLEFCKSVLKSLQSESKGKHVPPESEKIEDVKAIMLFALKRNTEALRA